MELSRIPTMWYRKLPGAFEGAKDEVWVLFESGGQGTNPTIYQQTSRRSVRVLVSEDCGDGIFSDIYKVGLEKRGDINLSDSEYLSAIREIRGHTGKDILIEIKDPEGEERYFLLGRGIHGNYRLDPLLTNGD